MNCELLIAILWIFATATTKSQIQETKNCNGKCLSLHACNSQGGTVTSNCTINLHSKNKTEKLDSDVLELVCCDFTKSAQTSCNAVKEGIRTTYFKSPGYPNFYEGSLVCQFQFNLDKTTAGVKLEFKDLKLPVKSVNSEKINSLTSTQQCDSDWFFIKGFPNWMPDPRCGDLTGFSTIVEIQKEEFQRQITIVFIMSSDQYKWDIKLTQISTFRIRKMDYCMTIRMKSWEKQIGQQYHFENPKSMENVPKFDTLLSKIRLSTSTTSSSNFFSNATPSNPIPWQVSIRLVENKNFTLWNESEKCKVEGIHLCSGTIIDDRNILTSSSCLISRVKISDLRIHVGSDDLCSGAGMIYTVQAITFHFNFGTSPFIHDDIALIRTRKSILFDLNTRPIELIRDTDLSETVSNGTFLISAHKGVSKKVQINFIPSLYNKTFCLSDKLGAEYGSSKTKMHSGKYSATWNSTICTKELSPVKESGNPLVRLDSEGKNPVLVAIFRDESVSKPKQVSRIQFYTHLFYYRNWILMGIS